MAAASGILYVALGLVRGSGGGVGFGDSRAKIATWVSGSRGPRGVSWTGAYLEILALLSFVVFAAVLAAALRRREAAQPWLSNVALGAGLITVTVKLASLPAAFALAYRAHEGFDPQLAAALTDTNSFSFVLTWPLMALMIAAASIASLCFKALPVWLGWAGAAATVTLLAAVPLAFGQGAFVAFAASTLWVLMASVTMIVSPGPDTQLLETAEPALATG